MASRLFMSDINKKTKGETAEHLLLSAIKIKPNILINKCIIFKSFPQQQTGFLLKAVTHRVELD